MESRRAGAQTIRAALCEIERGLFHVSYHPGSEGADGSEWDMRALPAFQTGRSASEARQRIEETAQGCGFAMVSWDCAAVIPALLRSAATGLLGPAGEITAPTAPVPAAGSSVRPN